MEANSHWDIAGIFGEGLQLTLAEPQAGLSIRKQAYPVGSAWNIEARGLDVRRDDEPQLGDPTDVTIRLDAPGAGSGARSRSPRSMRRWPVQPCRARSHCVI
jgi:hypothetical protein